jgi:hypothetical protein
MNIPHIDGEKSEHWMKRHQHRMAFLRTVTSFIGMVLSAIIFLKVFALI